MVTQIEAKEVFDRHLSEAEQFLSQYKTGVDKNQAITHFYQEMTTQYPAMQWFGIAALASAAVGKGIDYTDATAQSMLYGVSVNTGVHMVSTIEEINTLHKGLCEGNQGIFKNIFAIGHTYCELGVSGLKQVKDYNDTHQNKMTVTQDAINAFSGIDQLMYNDSVSNAFSQYQMHGVNNTFALNPQAAAALADVASKMTQHEQRIAGSMYQIKINDSMTLGDKLNSAIQNPAIALVLDQLKLFGPTIAGKYIPFTLAHGDISSFKDRMEYFEEEVSAAYFNALKTPGGAALLAEAGKALIVDMDITYVPPEVTYVYHENPLFKPLSETPSTQEVGALQEQSTQEVAVRLESLLDNFLDEIIAAHTANVENAANAFLHRRRGGWHRHMLDTVEDEQTIPVATPSVEEIRAPDFLTHYHEPLDFYTYL